MNTTAERYEMIQELLNRAKAGEIQGSSNRGKNVAFDFKDGESILLTFENEYAADNFLTSINWLLMSVYDNGYLLVDVTRVK